MTRARQRDREQCEKAPGRSRGRGKAIQPSFLRGQLRAFWGGASFRNSQRSKGWGLLWRRSRLGHGLFGRIFDQSDALWASSPSAAAAMTPGRTPCPPDLIDHTDENRSRWLMRTQIASGAAFFWGRPVGESWTPFITIVPRSPWPPTPVPQRPQQPSPVLSPVMLGDALGPGLHFQF